MKKGSQFIIPILLSIVAVITGVFAVANFGHNINEVSAATVTNYSYNSDTPFFNSYFDSFTIDNSASLDRWYDDETKFPLNTNSSNFCSLGTTAYDNVNGKTVTVDPFNRNQTDNLNDPNFGQSMLIYQCIQYKVAHPDAEVFIDFATYRLSVTASACLRRDSKFFGYMRSLFD